MQSAFSKRQMEILRNAMLTEGAKALSGRAPIRCRNCCGNQNVELRCTVCDKVKSLEGFAKNQRGERDSAVRSSSSHLYLQLILYCRDASPVFSIMLTLTP